MMLRSVLFAWLFLIPALSQALSMSDHPYLDDLVDRLVEQHGLDRAGLVATLEQAELAPKVVDSITRPAERLTWHRYRSLFITPSQIDKGVEFWEGHREVLDRAARETGVPAEIIVAIIGVETRYGATLGSHRVLDALATLTLQYPRRQKFFGAQLEHFLLLAHEHSLDPLSIRGSYAGAIGIPQFMPSSYREYAVDFNGDGSADLVNQVEDAIGSVANYLSRHQWRTGQPVALEIEPAEPPDEALTNQRRPNTTVGGLRARGIKINLDADNGTRAGVVRLEGDTQHQYRVAFENFYVLMRYNSSVLYATVVHELSDAVKRAYSG